MTLHPTTRAELDTIRAGIAAGKSSRQIAAETGLHRQTVLRVAKEQGLGEWRHGPPAKGATIPGDFAERYPTMLRRELAAHYGVATVTIDKWAGILGLKRPVRVKAEKPAPTRRPKQLPAPQPIHIVRRDFSRAGQAADFLRRLGPVVRCDRSGRYAQDGDHWRRGSTILSPADVIARAERQGFVAA